MEVLNNIIQVLKENKRKQVDLTNYLGITKNAFTNWKNGDNTSYMKHLPKIAEFLGVSVDYLLGNNPPSDGTVFTYAFYNELTHGLSPEQIEQLKNFAEFLRNS